MSTPAPRPPTWSNWAGNQTSRPRARLAPRSLAELVALVKETWRAGVPLRPLGTGHSWSEVAVTDGVHLDMRGLTRCLRLEPGVIEVEAGMTTRQLLRHLAPTRSRVAGLPIYTGMTIGGMVATGSHGSGLGSGALGDQVVAAKVVRPDGDLVSLSESDAEELRAARLSLGALGPIYSLTLRCLPAANLHVRDLLLPVERGLALLPELAQENDHLAAIWIPHSDRMWFYLASETSRAVDFGPGRRAAQTLWTLLWFRSIALLVRAAAGRRPGIVPPLLRFGASFQSASDTVRRSVDTHHYLPDGSIPRIVDSEQVVPFEHASAAYRCYLEALARHGSGGSYPIDVAVQARFVKGSDALLSPTGGRDSMCIEAASFGGEAADGFYREMGGELRLRFGARPHWGKLLPDRAALGELYAETLPRFEAVRRRFDPEGRCLNELLRGLVTDQGSTSPERGSPFLPPPRDPVALAKGGGSTSASHAVLGNSKSARTGTRMFE